MEIYIWIGIIIILSYLYNYFFARIKGKIGEYIVAFILNWLPKDKYLVLNDIMLKKENEDTTQIDHIVLSKYGIFVIETKNYKGWIYGNDYSNKWTQNLFGYKSKFLNPIIQNYGHVKTLEKLLNIEENKFIPIVVFSSSSTLKNEYKSEVNYFIRVNRCIKKYKEEIITEDINRIREVIINANIVDKKLRKNHVRNIHKNINEYENNICPKCGGNLIAKKGRFGYFKGCSNYPDCTYISKKKKWK